MKVTETNMQGIKTTVSINTEMILTCRLITITYTQQYVRDTVQINVYSWLLR